MRPVLSIVLSLLLAGAAFAQGGYTDHRDPPDLPGVEHIPAVIEAFNSADAATVAACIDAHFGGQFASMPASRHASVWAGALANWGPVEFEAVRTYEPSRDGLVVIVRAPVIEAWRAFVFGVGEDGRLTGMQFAPARAPSYLEPTEPLSVDHAVGRLDGFLDRLAERDMFSGTVIIEQDGRRVYERAVGLASRRFDVPNRMDTKFNLGSMNKMITAVAIAQLVEDGALAWDDTVGEHLSDYPNAQVRDSVQIRHLLSHTSGMGNHFTPEFANASKAVYREFREYLPLFVDQELAFEPGTDWSYSNAGFFVLGMLVEAASGQSYYDYVRERIYAPAGMTDTDAYDMDIPIKNLAIGYTRESFGDTSADDGARWMDETNGLRTNLFMHSIKGGPAGGGFSTTPDLARFAHALTSGALVSPATLAVLTSAKPELSSPGYGYGFSVEDHGHLGVVYGHGGGFPGINGILDIYPDQRLVVTVLANLDGGANLVAGRFMEWLQSGG